MIFATMKRNNDGHRCTGSTDPDTTFGAWRIAAGRATARPGECNVAMGVLPSALYLVLMLAFMLLLTHSSRAPAAAAKVTASATVIRPMSITSRTAGSLADTAFTVTQFSASLSTSGPLLRARTFVATPTSPASADATPTTRNGAVGAGSGAADAGTVISVTTRADGTLLVSGGSALTFAVDRLADGSICVEYN